MYIFMMCLIIAPVRTMFGLQLKHDVYKSYYAVDIVCSFSVYG